MPELPEVETFVRSLKFGGMTGEPILNRHIHYADLFWPRTLAFSDADENFLAWFPGKTVEDVARRGKYVILSIPPKFLIIHLRMSGDLRVESKNSRINKKHDRFLIEFYDGYRLVFNDPRKFGRIWLVNHPEDVFQRLGIEPLSSSFTAAWMRENARKKKKVIKTLLLDQTFIAGIGNIYSDEALFQAGIHPNRKAEDLSDAEIDQLTHAIQNVLQAGIAQNGASIDWVYRGGNFQHHFQVYHRNGEPCFRCGTPIERTVIGQRSAHFCPKCQR
jgi:formamidopyrimidine-DNA glycosylase